MENDTPVTSDFGKCSGGNNPEGFENPRPTKRQRLISPSGRNDEPDAVVKISAKIDGIEESTGYIQRDGFLCVSSETHDIIRTESHLPDLAAFAKRLDTACKSRWETRYEPYQNIAALLLQFEDDDLGVESEISELANMFRDTYRFAVDVFKISSAKRRYSDLFYKVDSFLAANDSLGNLCIVYYGGHGVKEGHGQPIWVSARQKGVQVNSSSVLVLFEERDADILLLFDSCQAVPNAFDSNGRGVVAALSATGFEPGEHGVAAEVGSHSFTHTLVQVLGRLSVPTGPENRPSPFADVFLHSAMLTELSKWHISLQKSKDGSYVRTMHGHHVMEPCRRRTPIYQFLSRNKKPKPIYLLPLQEHKISPLSSRQRTPIDSGDDISRSPHALVSVRLSVDALADMDIEAWVEWMLSVPKGVDIKNGGVTIEAIYPSLSTLVLLRMPVATWDLLPKDDAMSLVGYVTGENYVHSVDARIATSMDSILAPVQRKEDPDIPGADSALIDAVMATIQSSRALYDTVRSFKNHQQVARQLSQELDALNVVLQQLKEVVERGDHAMDALRLPLERCTHACREFEREVVKVIPRSEESKTSFRGWMKLRHMDKDIHSFIAMLSGYKWTIAIALGNINIRSANVTLEVLDEYKEMIRNTTGDLESQLKDINDRLQVLATHNTSPSPEDIEEHRQITEEKASVEQCLSILADADKHIQETQNRPNSRAAVLTSLFTTNQGQVITADSLSDCRAKLAETTSLLQAQLDDMNNRLQAILESGSERSEDMQERITGELAAELASVKQCLAMCNRASDQASGGQAPVFKDIKMAEDDHQIFVSTLGELFNVRTSSAGNRSAQWLGSMTDASLQQLYRDQMRTSSLMEGEVNFEAPPGEFESRYGTRHKLRSEFKKAA